MLGWNAFWALFWALVFFSSPTVPSSRKLDCATTNTSSHPTPHPSSSSAQQRDTTGTTDPEHVKLSSMFEHFRHTFVISSSFPTVFITSVKVSGSFVKVSTSFPQIHPYFLSFLPIFPICETFRKNTQMTPRTKTIQTRKCCRKPLLYELPDFSRTDIPARE